MPSYRPGVATGLALVLAASLAASSAAAAEASPAAGAPVYVEQAWLLYRAADPLQVELEAIGNLPSPCHVPEWSVDSSGDPIAVELWSRQQGDGLCAAVLEPFEVAIPLEGAAGGSTVELNGEAVGVIMDPADLGAIDGLAGAGWSFGMCAGVCVADLAVNGAAVALRGYEHQQAQPAFTNRGELTADGQAAIEAALASIETADLESVYGCPDCADGGAAWVRLVRGAGVSQHIYEFGNPPSALADLAQVTGSIMAALESCRSDEVVTVSVECQPQEP
jgi:hypothetical protein